MYITWTFKGMEKLNSFFFGLLQKITKKLCFHRNIFKEIVNPSIFFCEIKIDNMTQVFYVFDSLYKLSKPFNMV